MNSGSGIADDCVRVELLVRSLSPRESRGRIECIVDRLDDLVEAGTLADYQVVLTGAELPAMPADAVTDYGRYLLGRIAVFRRWVTATDHSFGSLFERRTVRSSITGEEHDALLLPTVVMAEYEGGALRFVSPCGEGADHVSVDDRLGTLATDEVTARVDRIPEATDEPPFEPPTQPN